MTIVLVAMTVILGACSSNDPIKTVKPRDYPGIKPGEQQPTAYMQQQEADLVIDFNGWDDWYVWKPEVVFENPGECNRRRFLALISDPRVGRSEAVVMLSKLIALRQTAQSWVSKLEAVFREKGYKRLIVQQSVSNPAPVVGFPIYLDRELEKR